MKQKKRENYLDRIPARVEKFSWKEDEKGIVTLEVENRGIFNRLFQFLLKKPKVSFIHLDEMGSFIWKRLDGKKNVGDLGEEVKAEFGEKAEPLYERLSKYVQILHSYDFVKFI
ncbi:MAG: PqqD family protein [Clostridia bacterium]|nr:PqqD family protein [Clostridia bacterium]